MGSQSPVMRATLQVQVKEAAQNDIPVVRVLNSDRTHKVEKCNNWPLLEMPSDQLD